MHSLNFPASMMDLSLHKGYYDTYDDFYSLSEGYSIASRNIPGEEFWKSRKGLIDSAGKVVIPIVFDDVLPVHNGVAAVCLKDEWSFVDTSGKFLTDECHSKELETRGKKRDRSETIWVDVKDGVMDVKESKDGLIGIYSKYVVTRRYDEDSPTSRITGWKSIDIDMYHYGYADYSGNIVIPMIYDQLLEPSEGLIAACLDDKWGYLDYHGNTVIPFIYDHACEFCGGMAIVKKNGYTMMINHSGAMLFRATDENR